MFTRKTKIRCIKNAKALNHNDYLKTNSIFDVLVMNVGVVANSDKHSRRMTGAYIL